MRKFRCSYAEGIFAEAEGPGTTGVGSLRDLCKRQGAICAHEAGHAVAAYLFGLFRGPIESSLATTETMKDGTIIVSAGGKSYFRDNPAIYTQAHFLRLAVLTCAGPAAERRYCIQRRMPLKMGTQGDHDDMMRTYPLLQDAGCMGDDEGEYFDSFADHAWSEAQRLMEIEAVWKAVTALAKALQFDVDEEGGVLSLASKYTRKLSGARAMQIMREAGLKRRSLSPLRWRLPAR